MTVLETLGRRRPEPSQFTMHNKRIAGPDSYNYAAEIQTVTQEQAQTDKTVKGLPKQRPEKASNNNCYCTAPIPTKLSSSLHSLGSELMSERRNGRSEASAGNESEMFASERTFLLQVEKDGRVECSSKGELAELKDFRLPRPGQDTGLDG